MKIERWVKRNNSAITVEAVLLDEKNVTDVAAWANNAQIIDELAPQDGEDQKGLNVLTPTGMARASLGWYVIKYEGRLYVQSLRWLEEMYLPEAVSVKYPDPADRKRL